MSSGVCLVIIMYNHPLECSEEEELVDEGDDLGQGFLPSPPSPCPPSPTGLSLLALSISVNSARLSMVLSVEEVSEVKHTLGYLHVHVHVLYML